MEIQSTSEMSPYFTMTKCNKLFTRNVLLSAQMGERASVVLICIITSQRAHSLKLFCMYDKKFEI